MLFGRSFNFYYYLNLLAVYNFIYITLVGRINKITEETFINTMP